MLAARLSLTTSNVVGFALPSEGSPSLSKDCMVLLSNCFGRPICSLKALEEVRSDSALMEGLSLPFKAVIESRDIVFAETEKAFRTKFSSSFGDVPLKFLKLPVFMCALSSDEPTPVLIGADGQSDTSIASRGQSTGSANSGDGLDLLPPKKDSVPGDWWLDLCINLPVCINLLVGGRFASNPGNGESSYRLLCHVFGYLPFKISRFYIDNKSNSIFQI